MANIIITITIETWIVWTGCFEICNAFNYFLTEDYRYLFSFSFIAFHKKRNALEMVLYCTCCLVVFSFINMLSFLFFFLRLSSIYFVIIYFILLFWTPIANYSFSLNSSRFLIISNWFFSPELYSIQTFSCFFYLFFLLLILCLLKLFWSLISWVCFLLPTSFWVISLILQTNCPYCTFKWSLPHNTMYVIVYAASLNYLRLPTYLCQYFI